MALGYGGIYCTGAGYYNGLIEWRLPLENRECENGRKNIEGIGRDCKRIE